MSSHTQIGPKDFGETHRFRQRHHLAVGVSIGSRHSLYMGLTHNISEGGIFVATERFLAIGTEVLLKLALGTSLPRDFQGVVRWIRPLGLAGDLPPGMGVQFRELDPESRDLLDDFLARQGSEPLFYDSDDD